MAHRIAIKDHFRETQLFTSRAVIAFIGILLILLAIVARMAYLQIIGHEHYTTLSQNNRVSLQPLAPTRGLIFDRNGVILAQNLPTYALEVVPERVDDLDATIAELAEIVAISPTDIERFHERRQQSRRFQPIALRHRLSDEEVARLAVNRHRFPGVEIAARLTRDYPQKNLAVHAVGYVGRINEQELQRINASNYAASSHIGKLGIEKAYEELLHGTVGFQRVETNVLGRTLRVLDRSPPVPGKDVVLTLDTELQRSAKQAMAGERGAVVAIDPRNGDVLVMASLGDYDPNLFVNGIDHKTYNALQTSRAKPLFNRALLGQYPPGSTIKPFVGLAGLESDTVTPQTRIFCRGWHTIKDDERKYRDWKKQGHGMTDLRKAITESCDVYYYDLAQTMGIDLIHDFLAPFGFGRKTGIDIAGEASGILPSTAWKRRVRGEPWYLGETLIAGIGQGYTLSTPLQLARATAILAGRGSAVRPRLLDHVLQSANAQQAIASTDPDSLIAKIKPEHWDTVISAMENVIYGQHGTARRLNRGQPYKIAGKTGTAQVFGIEQDEEYVEEDVASHLRDHALFIAFAPADVPRIAVAVIVENGGSGGAVAAPIAGAVIDQYLGAKP
ncbi:penicillin-binding protein 2 [Candidatus Tenderia electrophaga]|jgi:penicillin-binding protein 2|uniref:Peptidoglycan D,D-transpeptidase MrdA n=1 Tax=Candidatus Tenderia electrophaga TaxID=1748243 RepID=A0A0S2TGU0_9GAMM|nr:penicillin-binding protein 2 [Candidatus Tenderia electrophaga]